MFLKLKIFETNMPRGLVKNEFSLQVSKISRNPNSWINIIDSFSKIRRLVIISIATNLMEMALSFKHINNN